MPPKKGVFSYANFNLPALLHLASQLRGTPCSCNESQQPESGARNWAIILSFEDGVEWIFRSPRKSHDISQETMANLLESEVATMKYVRLKSAIPVPEVFDYSCTGSNPIGIPFILMTKAQGHALSHFSWNPSPEGLVSSRKPLPCLKRANKEKIMKQLGVISSQLLSLRFDKIESLIEEDEEYLIKSCLSPALLWHERYSLGDDVPRGPFQHAHDYYEAQLSALLLHVKELPLEQHAFFAPIPELGEFETLASYRSAVSRWNDYVAVGSKIDGTFVCELKRRGEWISSLSHPDLSTSNIFVDGDFNITCIIDWAFSSTVPISTLLVTPSLPHPRDEVDMTLAPTFRASLSEHFLQGGDCKPNPEFWESTRRAWLFQRLVTLDSLQDYRLFEELYMSVYQPEDEINPPKLFEEVQKEEEFVELAATLAQDDRPADEIYREEAKYFCSLSSESEAVARKLTMVAELSQGFVADKRLWRWIEDAMV